jgi:hypothetical protein
MVSEHCPLSAFWARIIKINKFQNNPKLYFVSQRHASRQVGKSNIIYREMVKEML